ncbi:hypothetical protein C8Q76DRAFT_463903 [Earliella scabrosa]|nr:hypothetical protein C8Q76DRAFT_463903 [Earliella scabrosa]
MTLWTQHPLAALRDFYDTSSTTVAQGSSSAVSTQELSPIESLESPSSTVAGPELPPSPGDRAQESPAIVQDSSVAVKMPHAYMYRLGLEEHHIPYARAESGDKNMTVTFSYSAAASWAKLLYNSYATILETLSHEEGLDKELKIVREFRRPVSLGECRKLQSALALLDDAIRGGIVERLFQEKLVKALNQQYVESMEKKTNSRLARAINRANSEADVRLSDIEYHYDPDDFKADEEDSQRHIIRHLAALTIPFRASVNIVHSCSQVPREITSMKAYQVIVRPDSQSSITPQYFNLFKAEFAKRCGGEPERVTQALDDVRGAVLSLKADVHAEATLMSLASGDMEKLKVHVDGTLTPIANLLPPKPIPFGVNKRCCAGCWLNF